MTIFIMAQGEGLRWRPNNGQFKEMPPYKHLLPIGKYGAPILGRTLTMLISHGVMDPIITIARPDASAGGRMLTFSEPTGAIVLSIASVLLAAENEIIILLGDVVFSHDLVERILQDRAPLRFYGRIGTNHFTGKEVSELFAMKVQESQREFVLKECEWLLSHGRLQYPPKMWQLYRKCADLPLHEQKFEVELLFRSYDYTDDVDSPEEYNFFWNKLNTEAAQDDDKCWCDLRRAELFP